MKLDSALSTFRIDSGASIAQASPWSMQPVTTASPAMAVMTDLTLVKAATIHPSVPLLQAEQSMIFQGVRMLFVVSSMPEIEGLVTSTDLHGDRQLQLVHDDHSRYDDLSVADVMTPLSRLDAVDFASLRGASVGNLIATLQRFGRHHMLVLERASASAGTPPRVRGVVSHAQIERQLGQVIALTPIASNFSEIERALS